jgi:hypothetical protein
MTILNNLSKLDGALTLILAAARERLYRAIALTRVSALRQDCVQAGLKIFLALRP